MTSVKIVIDVLDDEPIWLQLITDLLRDRLSYHVSCYTNHADFYANFSKEVDLAILDVRVKDGVDIFETVQTIADISPNTYIIVMSAHFVVPDVIKLAKMGVDIFVPKDGAHWLQNLEKEIDDLYPKLRDRAQLKGFKAGLHD